MTRKGKKDYIATTKLDIKQGKISTSWLKYDSGGKERFSPSLVEVEPSSFLEALGSQLHGVRNELSFLINDVNLGSSFIS